MNNQIENNTEIDTIWNRFQDDLELAIREDVPIKTVAKPNAREPFKFNREAQKLISINNEKYAINTLKRSRNVC